MKVMVFEFCRSGGMANVPLSQIPPSILTEGALMLKTLSDDLRRIPQLQVITILDERIDDALTRRRGARCVTPDSDWREEWPRLAESADACIVIAPESDHRLEACLECFETRWIPVLASDLQFLRHTTDKLATYQAWQAAGIPTPPTVIPIESDWFEQLVQHTQAMQAECEGWILKPREGVGCDGVQWIGSSDRLRSICQALNQPDQWIVQPRIVGSPGSISVIAGKHDVFLPPMRQTIEHMLGFTEYLGGEGPWREAALMFQESEENLTASWLHAIPGRPRGWIGIDFVLSNQGPIPIEVNASATNPIAQKGALTNGFG